MNADKLSLIAKKLCENPKGILAADESTNTIKKDLILLMFNQLLKNEETIGIFYLKLQI